MMNKKTLIGTAALMMPLVASAGAAPASACNDVWMREVAALSQALSGRSIDEPVLALRSSDGAVFDCLGKLGAKPEFDRIARISHDILKIKNSASYKADAPGALKNSDCTLSAGQAGAIGYLLLQLPGDDAELASPRCQRLLAKAARSTRKSLMLDVPANTLNGPPQGLTPYLKDAHP